MHFAIHVGGHDAALAKVEAAGARRIWKEVLVIGPLRTICVHDLDDNTIELIDGSYEDCKNLDRVKTLEEEPPEGSDPSARLWVAVRTPRSTHKSLLGAKRT